MPLIYLLYRCPRCGHDPMTGEKDEALCSGCGTRYFRGGEGGLIRIVESSGEVWEVPSHQLTAAMLVRGAEAGPVPVASDPSIRSAEVLVRQSGREAPVRWKGAFLGFAEAMGEARPGVLDLTEEALYLRRSEMGEGQTETSGQPRKVSGARWPLEEIRAVQTSSSSLQFSPAEGGLVECRFLNDSPYRWENLLREALRAFYRKHGLGEIVEFQPRIVAE